MLKMKVNISKDFKSMSRRLQTFVHMAENEASKAAEEMHKSIPVRYVQSVDAKVYGVYKPIVYERTMHIRGDTGAIETDISRSKGSTSYRFEINENSRDPVDGTTWGEKADNLESGSSKMYGSQNPMPDREFISSTQEDIVNEANRISNRYLKQMQSRAKRL